MKEVVENQACSILNDVDPKDSIDLFNIVEDNLKQSSSYYVEHFKAFAIKTAQSTLEMCRVVAEAKKALAKDRFLTFCKDIGHKNEDATIRKYLLIGKKYEQFINYAELLPNSWTSIYTITQLPADVFEALALTGNSMANMTGAQIKALMAPPEPVAAPSAGAGDSTPATQHQAQPTAKFKAADDTADDTADAASAANATASAATASKSAELTSAGRKSSVSVPTAAADGGNAVSSTTSAQEFAKQATSKVVADACSASKCGAVEDEQEFVPYSIVLRFNSEPPEAAARELTEMLIAIRAKYRLNLAILSEAPVTA